VGRDLGSEAPSCRFSVKTERAFKEKTDGINSVLLLAHVVQVTLGISTLLTYVPVSLGSAHQAGALTLFTVMLMLLHTLRRPKAALAGLNSLHPDLAARRTFASSQAHA